MTERGRLAQCPHAAVESAAWLLLHALDTADVNIPGDLAVAADRLREALTRRRGPVKPCYRYDGDHGEGEAGDAAR